MTVTIDPPRFLFKDLQQGLALPVAPSALDYFRPPASLASNNNHNTFFAVGITPKAATSTVIVPADALTYASVDDAADTDLNAVFPSQGDGFGDLRRLMVYARRKPGTTGAIAAQTVTVRKTDGSGTVLATFSYPAAAASTELECSGVDQTWKASVITAPASFHFTFSVGADPDVELVALFWGEN